MADTNLGNRNQEIHETLSTHCPRTMDISMIQMLSDDSSGALLSRSLPIIKGSSSENVKSNRGGVDGRNIDFRSTGKERKTRHLINNRTVPFSRGSFNYPNLTVNHSSSSTSSTAGDCDLQVRSERTNGLSDSNLSLSTLSLSSNEGDDQVTEQFWKLLADDGRITAKTAGERVFENGSHNRHGCKSNGVKEHEGSYSSRE